VNLGRTGIWSIELRVADPAEIAEAAAELEELGYGALWIPGLDGGDILGACARLLSATRSLTVATGVTSIWLQPAAGLAADRARLQHHDRLLTGLGVSSPASAGSRPFRPLADMNAYLDGLDASDEPLPVSDRMLAAMGPQMIKLAARRAAGIHPFMVTPNFSAQARELLGAGPLLAPYQAVVLDRDATRARAAGRGFLGAALAMPAYRNSLRRQGFTDADLADGGSDRLIDAVLAWGDLDAIADRVRAHLAAGADHVSLHVLPQGPSLPRDAWRELATLGV